MSIVIPVGLIPAAPLIRSSLLLASRIILKFYWNICVTGMHASTVSSAWAFISDSVLCVARRTGLSITPVGSGLYWHFVDIVWIFLFPLLYLLGRHLEH